mmetsp:Transcript_12220/g.22710  ORF Transcript_12220/g.22710 Transcript_12220/m.22710 type:complete len:134 (-) Transcript_12220:476-877(-)
MAPCQPFCFQSVSALQHRHLSKWTRRGSLHNTESGRNSPGRRLWPQFRWGNPHPIRKHTKLTVPQSVQLSYDDDASGTGNAEYNAKCLTFLVWNGPAFGYFPEPANAIYICKGHDKMIARHHFEELGLAIRYS